MRISASPQIEEMLLGAPFATGSYIYIYIYIKVNLEVAFCNDLFLTLFTLPGLKSYMTTYQIKFKHSESDTDKSSLV